MGVSGVELQIPLDLLLGLCRWLATEIGNTFLAQPRLRTPYISCIVISQRE